MVAVKTPHSFELVSAFLRYDPETGLLYWRQAPRWAFVADRNFNIWSAKYPHKEAFTARTNAGYRVGEILNEKLLAHRVVWLLCNRSWPAQHIDHINGDKLDNRIENLRDVPMMENQHNAKRSSANRSGVNGVYWASRDRKWVACIGVAMQSIVLGYFDNFEDAVTARQAADVQYGFSERHGKPL